MTPLTRPQLSGRCHHCQAGPSGWKLARTNHKLFALILCMWLQRCCVCNVAHIAEYRRRAQLLVVARRDYRCYARGHKTCNVHRRPCHTASRLPSMPIRKTPPGGGPPAAKARTLRPFWSPAAEAWSKTRFSPVPKATRQETSCPSASQPMSPFLCEPGGPSGVLGVVAWHLVFGHVEVVYWWLAMALGEPPLTPSVALRHDSDTVLT